MAIGWSRNTIAANDFTDSLFAFLCAIVLSSISLIPDLAAIGMNIWGELITVGEPDIVLFVSVLEVPKLPVGVPTDPEVLLPELDPVDPVFEVLPEALATLSLIPVDNPLVLVVLIMVFAPEVLLAELLPVSIKAPVPLVSVTDPSEPVPPCPLAVLRVDEQAVMVLAAIKAITKFLKFFIIVVLDVLVGISWQVLITPTQKK